MLHWFHFLIPSLSIPLPIDWLQNGFDSQLSESDPFQIFIHWILNSAFRNQWLRQSRDWKFPHFLKLWIGFNFAFVSTIQKLYLVYLSLFRIQNPRVTIVIKSLFGGAISDCIKQLNECFITFDSDDSLFFLQKADHCFCFRS